MMLAAGALFTSLLAAPAGRPESTTVLLADFKGTDPDATHKWRANNVRQPSRDSPWNPLIERLLPEAG